jgi:hypothetical protein
MLLFYIVTHCMMAFSGESASSALFDTGDIKIAVEVARATNRVSIPLLMLL